MKKVASNRQTHDTCSKAKTAQCKRLSNSVLRDSDWTSLSFSRLVHADDWLRSGSGSAYSCPTCRIFWSAECKEMFAFYWISLLICAATACFLCFRFLPFLTVRGPGNTSLGKGASSWWAECGWVWKKKASKKERKKKKERNKERIYGLGEV